MASTPALLNTIRVNATRSTRSSIIERASSAAAQIAVNKLAAKVPASVRKQMPLARQLLNGNIGGAVDSALDALFQKMGISGTLLPNSVAPGASPLFGGITAQMARDIFEQSRSTEFAKKNLWCLRVRNIQGGEALDINMFATDVSYSSFSVQGDSVHVGSGSFDSVTNSERREMRVSTLDDTYGSVKRWFRERHDRMCNRDGTFGLPIDYVFRVDVLHAFINEEVPGAVQGYVDTYIMRPGSMDTELSRRDDGMQDLQLTFVQWDTFAALS